MPSVSSFSIPVDDYERARRFYEGVFGWVFQKAWEYDGPQGRESYFEIHSEPRGTVSGGMTAREYAGQGIGVGIEVPDLEGYLSFVRQHGGRVIIERSEIPGRVVFAVCQDTEANTFVIYRPL